MACRLPGSLRPASSWAACLSLLPRSKPRTWGLCPCWPATPPAGSQPISNAHRWEHQPSQCRTFIMPCSPKIQRFRYIPCIVSNLPMPDLLHTMQIGMLDHLQKLIFHFIKSNEQLNKYNAICISVPAYHAMTPKDKSYEEVSQWNEKEMKEMSRLLLGVVTQSLWGGSPAQRPIFNHAIECTQTLLEFYMYARYKSHYDATLSYMEDALHRVHTFENDFLLGEPAKRWRPKPMPWERNSWKSGRYRRKQMLKLGRSPRSGPRWTPGRNISATR